MTADQWLPGEQEEGKWIKGNEGDRAGHICSVLIVEMVSQLLANVKSVTLYISNVQFIEDQSYLKKAILFVAFKVQNRWEYLHNIYLRMFIQNVKNLLQLNKTALVLEAQSCPILCDAMDGILQARILEWVAIAFSRRSSPPRNQTCVSGVSCIAGGFFTVWATHILLLKWAKELNILPKMMCICPINIEHMLNTSSNNRSAS